MFKPKALKVLKLLLLRGSFKQKEASKECGVALGYVNELVQKLRKKFIVSRGNGVVLTDARRLLLLLSAESSMAEKLYGTYEVPGKKEEVEKKIAEKFNALQHAFTLLSALPFHYKGAHGQQVSVYVFSRELAQVDKLIRQIGGRESNIGNVQIFEANEGVLFDRKKFGKKHVVSLSQLLIDLFAYPPLLYIGQELLENKEKQKVK